MIHGIHAGGKRKNPLIIIGRNGSVNDYSHVRFPSELRNCVNCHIDKDQKGTFELPMVTKLGSTISTGSFLGSNQIDIDPGNDLKISPIAATCSGCHDDPDKKQHMIRMGASFGVPQSYLDNHKNSALTAMRPGRFATSAFSTKSVLPITNRFVSIQRESHPPTPPGGPSEVSWDEPPGIFRLNRGRRYEGSFPTSYSRSCRGRLGRSDSRCATARAEL